MIKINLVPVKEKKKQREIFIGICVGIVFLIMGLGMAWFYLQRIKVKSDLKNEIDEVKKESEGYQDKINEVKDIQNKEASLEVFKKTIKSISETQREVIVAVDQVALGLPEGVWLTAITQGKGKDANKFVVTGYAFAQSDLQNYFNVFQKPGGFLKDASLDLKNISASTGKNKQIYQFEIDLTVADRGS
jgi:Tfp pilus assembly protein PilN